MAKYFILALFLPLFVTLNKMNQNTINCFTKYQNPIDSIDGKLLFVQNCTPCHRANNQMLLGPGLAKSTSLHSMTWLIKWTRDSQEFIKSGDKDAVAIYKAYNGLLQPAYNLSDKKIEPIYNYIDNYNRTNSLQK